MLSDVPARLRDQYPRSPSSTRKTNSINDWSTDKFKTPGQYNGRKHFSNDGFVDALFGKKCRQGDGCKSPRNPLCDVEPRDQYQPVEASGFFPHFVPWKHQGESPHRLRVGSAACGDVDFVEFSLFCGALLSSEFSVEKGTGWDQSDHARFSSR